MRVLIVSALFACACAAPSGILAPVAVAPVAVAPLPAVAVAPVNSGDLQGALIDAKVQTEDFLRSVADQQRQAVEQAVVDTNEKVIEVNDQAQEKAVETFWANEEKKWQEFDAVQTAQAQLDGKLASSSEAVAKSLVVPAIATPVVSHIGPVVAPYSPYIYAPGILAPGLKTVQIPEAFKTEEKKEETKSEEKTEEVKSDSVQVESANVKTAEAVKETIPETKYVVGQTPLLASFPLSPLKFAPQPWAGVVAPGFKTIVPFGAHVLTPTVLKTVW